MSEHFAAVKAALKQIIKVGATYSIDDLTRAACEVFDKASAPVAAIPIRLTCPTCNTLHIDEGKFAVTVHHTHACQHCGAVWRPALVPTVGVQFLPGFKNNG